MRKAKITGCVAETVGTEMTKAAIGVAFKVGRYERYAHMVFHIETAKIGIYRNINQKSELLTEFLMKCVRKELDHWNEGDADTDDLYAAMFAPVPFITFSPSPLWPWCFGNCVLEIDGRENKRPVKRAQTDSCKIDPVQAIIMALDLYERYEGMNH